MLTCAYDNDNDDLGNDYADDAEYYNLNFCPENYSFNDTECLLLKT